MVFWLETNGLHAFTQGFKGIDQENRQGQSYFLIFIFSSFSHVDQKIDGMCLKEGLSDDDLVCCNVHTVGEKRLLQRKLSELVGKPQNLTNSVNLFTHFL